MLAANCIWARRPSEASTPHLTKGGKPVNELNDTESFSSSRRTFLANASALSGASLLGVAGPVAAEPSPEVRRIRLLRSPAICGAPQILAEEMLRAEGFAEVEYVREDRGIGASAIAQGAADISMWDAPSTLPVLDGGDQIVVLAGIHVGCWELFVNGQIRALRDLKGKTVAIWGIGAGDHVLLSSMLAYVGMDPRNAVNWLAGPKATDPMRLFVDGKVDAFMGFAPQPQELRARKIGRVIIDTSRDRPWSQYYCCIVVARRDFVRAHPVATKLALRAFLKAADVCAQEPERVARLLASKGVEPRYEIGLEVLKDLPYNRWREANPEDTLRFYALRLHEVGMVKTTPQKIIAQGTDWRFLNELKKELKA
jgi:NitT/TauT family transport system substrate-binding protein